MKIFRDIRTAIKLTGEVRKAREAGATVEIRKTYSVPMLKTDYWVWTPEACLFKGELRKPFQKAFESLPMDVQHSLTFTPGNGWNGSWPDRVRFWQQHLRPFLTPKQYHEAVGVIANWGCRCVKRRLEAAV